MSFLPFLIILHVAGNKCSNGAFSGLEKRMPVTLPLLEHPL